MHHSLGPQPFALPSPIWLVGVYDNMRRPNIMACGKGGLCCSLPPCLAISVRRNNWTYRVLSKSGVFTLSIPDASLAAKVDFCGMISGETEDKFAALGFTPVCGEHVDAPYVAECPVVLELVVRHTLDLGSHVQFVGEIMDVKISENCLRPDGLPDPAAINPLLYVPLIREYYATGPFVSRAFAVGKTVKRVARG